MKKIILATTVCLLALGMSACKDQKKDEASAGQEQAAPATESHENGAAADMGTKVDEAITDVKKDIENAAEAIAPAAPVAEPAPGAEPATVPAQ